jgi:hypothetical protein
MNFRTRIGKGSLMIIRDHKGSLKCSFGATKIELNASISCLCKESMSKVEPSDEEKR